MSKIGDRLQRLHRTSKPIGFGFGTTAAQPRRMLLFVYVNSDLEEEMVRALLQRADGMVLGHHELCNGSSGCRALSGCDDTPIGLWVGPEAGAVDDDSQIPLDFLMCDLDGPADALARKDRGCLVVVDSDLEASRLRAVAELGVDAVVVRADSLDLSRVSAIVACRRVHSVSGKPVVLQVNGVVETGQIVALWSAGVDALMVNADSGVEMIAAIHDTMCSACYDARRVEGSSVVAIGSSIRSFHTDPAHEDDEGEGDDDYDE